MVKINNIEFDTSIGVLFALKEAHGFKTLQETYELFQRGDMDIIIEVLQAAHNRTRRTSPLSTEEFLNVIADNGVGFLMLADIFQEVVEKLMYDGLSDEQVKTKKKFLAEKVK